MDWYTIEEDSGTVFHIYWKERKPITKELYNIIKQRVRDSHDYRQSNVHFEDMFTLATEHKCSVHQLMSLRGLLVKQKIMDNHFRMTRDIEHSLLDQYTKWHNRGIMALADKYDFPPRNLLRGILLASGKYSSTVLYNVFVGKVAPEKVLSPRDLVQFHIADANDAESMLIMREIEIAAAKTENQFVELCRSIGIRLKTQEELAEEQKEKNGRAVATPDVLFIDKVFINEEEIGWIDFKDYIGSTTKMFHSKTKKQAERNNEMFGSHGMFAYRHGYVEDTKYDGATCLDVGLVFDML